MRRAGLFALTIASLLEYAGCSHVPARPPLPEELRMHLGTVAVVSARSTPTTQLRVPAKGAAAGVGRGATTGAVTGMAVGAGVGLAGARGCQANDCLAALALVPVGGLVGAGLERCTVARPRCP